MTEFWLAAEEFVRLKYKYKVDVSNSSKNNSTKFKAALAKLQEAYKNMKENR